MKCSILFFQLMLAASQVQAMQILSEERLGELLFFDTSFSVNRSMSCSTCHDPAKGFSDQRENPGARIVSLGDDLHSIGTRNAPTATYANTTPQFHFDTKNQEYVGGQFLDGRARDLAEQAIGPPVNPLEMALPDGAEVVRRIRANPLYEASFERLYGKDIFERSVEDTTRPPAYIAFGKAIEAFENTEEFAPYNSKYDRFLKGEYDLTVLEDLGRTLFFSNNNVNCSTCHKLNMEDAEKEPFTNHQYRNIGVPSNRKLLAMGQAEPGYIDHGLLENPAVTDKKYDGKFKNATLRNVAVTGPYMHNGVFKDLRTVIEFYDHYNNPRRKFNPETGTPWQLPEVPATVDKKELKAQPLTDRKVDALVAFLKTLTDKRYESLLEAQEKSGEAY